MAGKIYYMKSEYGMQGVGFRDIIPQFCKQSTVHGVQHIGRTAGYIKLVTWLVLFLSCTAGLSYNIYAITSSYLDFLVYVKIAMQDSKELAFPAVTVCNTNPVKKSELFQSPRMEALIASWQSEQGERRRKRKKRDACPNPVEPVSGVCFWREDTGRISQAAAKQHCEDIGARLAVVDTPEKFTHVFQSPLQLASSISVWLDLKYNDVTGTWQWAESVDLSWSNWESDPGAPPSDADKTCVYVSYETDQSIWRNVRCDGVPKYGIIFGLRPLCMDGSVETVESTTEPVTTTISATTTVSETTTFSETTTEEVTTTVEETTIEQTTVMTTIPETTTFAETTTIPATTTTEITTTEERTTMVGTTTKEPSTTNAKTTTETTVRYETTEVEETTQTTSVVLSGSITTTEQTSSIDTTQPDVTSEEPTAIETTTTEERRTTEKLTEVLNADGEVLREDFKKEGDVMRILSEITDEEKKSLGYKYPDFVLECSFNGKVCTEKDFEQFFDAVYGNCYVFNSGWNTSQTTHNARLSGRQRGFHLLMNVGQDEYIRSVGKQAGAVVVVHDQTRMPFPEDEGILAVPGHVTSVGIRKMFVERLGDQYSGCITDTDSVKHTIYSQMYGVNYSVSACEKTCYQDHVIQTCGCADPQYPTTESVTGINQISACDARNKTQGDCVNRLTLLYIEDSLNCSCPLLCNSIMYTYKVSKTIWPSDAELDTVRSLYGDQFSSVDDTSSLEETIRKNLLRLEVYFEELNFETMTETPKYPLARYISGLGAIIGLWLGCSVLSLLEILEVITDTLYLFCKKLLQCSNKSEGSTEDHPIIISPKIRKRVSPCVISSMEINPDENIPSKSSVSVYDNPAYQGGTSRGRRIRHRRRSTLDNIFAVGRQKAGSIYEINRLIPNGRDEGYSSEEGSPVPKGTHSSTTHTVQLHVPHIVMESPLNGHADKSHSEEETKPRTRHERFLFGRS